MDQYVAISRHVAARIREYYGRGAAVVYPPVDTTFYHPNGSAPGSYFLIVSALVPYKQVDVAIEACRLAGVPLRIAGDGPERERLRSLAGSHVEFLGPCSDADIRELYRGSRAMLLPGEEDFGIAPVEALACGRPVVGLARGGVTETVSDGTNRHPRQGRGSRRVRRRDCASRRHRVRPDPHPRAGAAVLPRALLRGNARADRVDARVLGRRRLVTTRPTRRLATFHAVSDALLGMAAFGLAYAIRFEAGLIAAPKGQPPFGQYLVLLPFIGLLVPLAFHLQGAYRPRGSRTRVDDFFAVLVGNGRRRRRRPARHACTSRSTSRARRSGRPAPTRCRESSGCCT